MQTGEGVKWVEKDKAHPASAQAMRLDMRQRDQQAMPLKCVSPSLGLLVALVLTWRSIRAKNCR